MWAIGTIDSGGILAVAAVIATLSGFVAAALKSVYPMFLGLILSAVYYIWRQHRAKLIRISDDEFKLAKRSSTLMLLAALFPSLFS
jgi:4-hydroxybenzoate polyprenyltransferase